MLAAVLGWLHARFEPLRLRRRAPFSRELAREDVDLPRDHFRGRLPFVAIRALTPSIEEKLGPRRCRRAATAHIAGERHALIVPEPEAGGDGRRVAHEPDVGAVV